MVDVNMTALTCSTQFPFVESFTDYHDIDYHAEDLTKRFNRRIGFAEIGFCENGNYWGIFYVGRKPKKAVIKQLLNDDGFKSMYDDE